MLEAKNDLQNSLQNFKKLNFKFLGPIAFLVFVLLSFVDNSLSSKGLFFFMALRFLFVLPTLFFSQITHRFSLEKIDWIIFISFLFAGTGVAVISYFLGGIQSDYYFGLIIVSFVQYAFAPLNRNLTIALDTLFFVIFFGLNTIPFDFPVNEITKQISNYLSFAILKFVIVIKSQGLVVDALKKVRLERELENQKNIQKVLGELCHLFNNPLFISMSLLKKLIKNNNLSEEERSKLDKIYHSNERMNRVLRKMLAVTDKKDGKVEIKDIIS